MLKRRRKKEYEGQVPELTPEFLQHAYKNQKILFSKRYETYKKFYQAFYYRYWEKKYDYFVRQVKEMFDQFEGCQMEANEVKTYDIEFHDNTTANSKGFSESKEYCIDYIKSFNGSDVSYFADYKGGTVNVVCNETGDIIHSETVK